MNYYIFINNDGTVRSGLKTNSDHSNNPDARAITEVQYKNIEKDLFKKKEVNGVFVDIPRKKRKITKQEFFDLFTDQQFEAIADSDNAKVKTFLLKVRMMDSIDTESNYIKTALNRLENPLGLIGVGEAVRILTDAQNLADN